MTLTEQPTTIDDAIARVSAVLDELRAAQVTPMATPSNPDGSPGNVAAGELIESAWGNATANTIGKLKLAQRYTAGLSLPLVTVDTTGTFISGQLVIPAAAYRRIAVVTVNVLLTATADVDLQLYGIGAVLMRKARRAAIAGNGSTLALTTQTAIAAGASDQYAAKLAAVGGTSQVACLGGSEFNYLDAVVIPTLAP
jgi:hypothetical protein